MAKRSLVSVVDDNGSLRESLPDLLREFDFAVQAFSSAEEFLASDCVGQIRCLILDIATPGMSGPLCSEIDASSEEDTHRIYYRSRRRNRPSAATREGRRGVPVQAIQRRGSA